MSSSNWKLSTQIVNQRIPYRDEVDQLELSSLPKGNEWNLNYPLSLMLKVVLMISI